jgi:Zn-dependent protease with chaperone function
MSLLETAGSMECPSCAAAIVFDRRFSPWCAECDWNVDAGRAKPTKLSRVERRRVALAARVAAGSARAVAEHAPDRAPRWGVASTVALVASVAVIGAWTLLVLAGVSMVGGGPLAVVFGLFLLGIAAISRPRLGSKPEGSIARADAPELYALVDDIAAALKAPKIHLMAIDGAWSAATTRYGPLQRTAIIFGLPLWHGLSDSGRLAVLGHEVGHSVNGDTSRGFIEWTALRTLETWSVITEPDELITGAEVDGLVAIASIPANLAMLALSWFFGSLSSALQLVLLRPRLQAEFFADRLAATMAGAPAMADALDRTRLHRAYERAVAAIAIASRSPDELFTEVRTQLASTPPSEFERLRRQEARAPFDRDVTHPPIRERIAMLEQRAGSAPPLLDIDPTRMRAIDAELARIEPRVARELVEEYLADIS